MSEPPAGPGRLPGDLTEAELVARFLRVNHAGELGAVRIYEGQLAVLGRSPAGAVIREMAEKEQEHLKEFVELIGKRRVRPTALQPLWHLAGFALGAATAALGPKAAMACTVAVEEVIDDHYRRQVERLPEDEGALKDLFEQFRQDEMEHRDTAIEHGARGTPGYRPLTSMIKAGSRLAIWLSERF
jgi:ubiquinone biosynthesis monooxygenase Coq7